MNLLYVVVFFFVQAAKRVKDNLSVARDSSSVKMFNQLSTVSKEVVEHGGPIQQNPLGV